MAYCICRIVERRLGADHGIEDGKVQRKFDKQLAARERETNAAGRAVHPLHRITLAHRLAKLSAQFIRTLRNHLFSHEPVLALLKAFSAALRSYMRPGNRDTVPWKVRSANILGRRARKGR